MNKFLLALLFAVGVILQASSQVKVGRTILDYSIEQNGETLKMNGAGDRSVLSIELYSIALYLKQKSNDALGICYADETMTLRLVITSKIIDRETFVESISEDFDRATDHNVGPLQARIDKTLKLFSDPIIKNDVFDFSYEKGVGTHFIKNEKELGVIEGQDFKFALYKIWLGDEPVTNRLKDELLGSF